MVTHWRFARKRGVSTIFFRDRGNKLACLWTRDIGDGPTLIETVTFRMGPHSSSDDPKRYQAPELFEAWQKRDPIERYREWLTGKKLWSKDWEDELTATLQKEIAEAVEAAESTPAPDVETMFDDVYATLPKLLEEQREALRAQIRASGAIEDSGGAFPL